MGKNPQVWVQEANKLMDDAMDSVNSLLDEADNAVKKRNYEVPIDPEYISHEDILSQEKIEPDFKRLDPKPNEYSKTGVSKDRGARAFCDQFRGMPYPLIFSKKGKLRTGQKALDIIVSSGLATSEEAKGVLKYLTVSPRSLDSDDCFGYTCFHTLMNGQGKAIYKVGVGH